MTAILPLDSVNPRQALGPALLVLVCHQELVSVRNSRRPGLRDFALSARRLAVIVLSIVAVAAIVEAIRLSPELRAQSIQPTVGPTIASTTIPTLGRSWTMGQKGYGQIRPTIISNGGDPTGLVQDVVWQSWGGPIATGTGISEYVGPNQIVANGTEERSTVVAFNRGICRNTFMYEAVEWYFPQHGESFNPNAYIDICTGTYVGQR